MAIHDEKLGNIHEVQSKESKKFQCQPFLPQNAIFLKHHFSEKSFQGLLAGCTKKSASPKSDTEKVYSMLDRVDIKFSP